MGPRYEAYFEQQWGQEELRRTAGAARFIDQVRDAITDGIANADIPYPLTFRPDARQFLLVNLQDMVVLPTDAVDPGQLNELVLQTLPNDVTRIVRTAAAAASAAGDTDVSAHDVLAATAQLWPELGFAAPWRWEE